MCLYRGVEVVSEAGAAGGGEVSGCRGKKLGGVGISRWNKHWEALGHRVGENVGAALLELQNLHSIWSEVITQFRNKCARRYATSRPVTQSDWIQLVVQSPREY